ncbi:hypothetical protein HETIRDRAFT_332035 [Heterobasidion irregulare TC 32-1]|uniref:RNA helicase n=1 Tax=Heterobasidion irregulare (strain TC 32-1) TaxID=747525 RepID=W4JMW9_HETIT|nr:uncharacterized protein HETIRDRAFT_332035 [Heterobasidion irregulare TC 32-1]ETW74902.1 hypothetical protein HETIRDRAFT_332035 [Heterobasidion irregulare TC 32-1]
MAFDDFIMTIESDQEDTLPPAVKPAKSRVPEEEGAQLNPDFVFDPAGDFHDDILDGRADVADLVTKGSRPEPISVDDIIARRRLTKNTGKRKREEEEDSEQEDSDEEQISTEDEGEDLEDEASEAEESLLEPEENEEDPDPLVTSDEEGSEQDGLGSDDEQDEGEYSDASSSSDDSEPETKAEKARKAAFFSSDTDVAQTHSSFLTMNLSRPVLKALTTLGFHTPTPIQAATIPVGLLGKDVVGNAVTGSGKTAAFIIPMIERLLYRDKGKGAAATRCLVLVPTRELAVQCYEVGKKLAAHTDIQLCLIVGGLSLKAQEVALRARPDIVIATPGRLIDHIRNSPTFTLDVLDVLVLDEADRMLSDGFADELAEIIKSCPTSRQTMLFSATMTDSVDELVKMSLDKPVRLFVDPRRSTARGLTQEFVRVRAGKETDRTAILVALCKRTFKTGVLIFFRSKKLAHQIRIVFSLLGMSCEELHGDLTQEQRLRSLQLFRDNAVDFLMATDLASRGLDIKGIETVINFDMPGQLPLYLHRVGRTARAGKKGRSVTLVGEADRKMLKAAIKHASKEDQVRHRTVPPEVISKWSKKLESLTKEVAGVLQDEKEEKHIRKAEMELKKGQNMIEHEDEIYSRPARTWFQSSSDKQKASDLSKLQYQSKSSAPNQDKLNLDNVKPKRDKFSGLTRRVKRRKMALEEEKEEGDRKGVDAAIRAAKKASRPAKIGVPVQQNANSSKKAKRKTKVTSHGSVFGKDMEQRSNRGEGVRAKKGDRVAGMKKGGKRKGKSVGKGRGK